MIIVNDQIKNTCYQKSKNVQSQQRINMLNDNCFKVLKSGKRNNNNIGGIISCNTNDNKDDDNFSGKKSSSSSSSSSSFRCKYKMSEQHHHTITSSSSPTAILSSSSSPSSPSSSSSPSLSSSLLNCPLDINSPICLPTKTSSSLLSLPLSSSYGVECYKRLLLSSLSSSSLLATSLASSLILSLSSFHQTSSTMVPSSTSPAKKYFPTKSSQRSNSNLPFIITLLITTIVVSVEATTYASASSSNTSVHIRHNHHLNYHQHHLLNQQQQQHHYQHNHLNHNQHPRHQPIYTNEWVIEVKGGEETAKEVAKEHHLVYIDKVMDDFYLVKHRRLSKRSIKSTYKFNRELSSDSHITWFQQQVAKVRVKRDANRVLLTDPKWPRMWYMNQENGNGMNIMVAWKRGYTGRNVVVSILDDGIEKDHPDLKKNYDPEASYDVNDHDPDPQPRYDNTNENKHGTRCAGEVAAQFNNSLCGIGVAYNARIGGVRMLDGDVTDAVEAKSLSWKSDYVQIYSASWGPDDDGKTVDGPGPITAKAFEDGILKGRNGLGSIFVWASGNGGQLGDDCNCDGYTNLIYTLSISGVSENGNVPWYSEACSSALASAYSSGNSSERQIVTTDLNKQCTENHTGTSASAPLAVGMIALTMEANTQLTWRDVQHIVVLGAKRSNLVDADFKLNGANKYVSHRFGFGLMDVGRMVELAENWTRVPAQRKCVVPRTISQKGLSVNSKLNISLTHNGCLDTDDEINYLEHVQVIISLASQKRGELEIFLISPSGTKSTLLGKRPNDFSTDGFLNWTFMTTHCWGETAAGTWKLEIRNSASLVSPSRLLRWTLVLYGTKKEPYSAPLQHLNPQRPPPSSVSSSSASSLSSSSIYKHSLFPYHYSHSHQHSLHHFPHRHHQHHQQQHNNIQKIDFMPYSSLGGSKSASYDLRPSNKPGPRSNHQSNARHDPSHNSYSNHHRYNYNNYNNYNQHNDFYDRDTYQYYAPLNSNKVSIAIQHGHCIYLLVIFLFICLTSVRTFV